MRHVLQKLWQKGCEFLGTQHALMAGAMTWVSDHNLVAAISNAGGFGILACGAMTPDLLRKEIQLTRLSTSFPFGVNLIVMHPDLTELIQVCIEENVSHVILAGGIPLADSMTLLKKYTIKIMCFAPSLIMGKKLIRMGADALIIEGMEAGGHIGAVSTTVLAQEILPHIQDVPVFIAGGIGRGESIVSYLEMGASGCQLGTRFVCAYESRAHSNFKKAFIQANARDAVSSTTLDPRFPVIPVRALQNKATQNFQNFQRQVINRVDKGIVTLKEGQLEIEHFWAGALRRAVVDGDVENGSLMAGQSVGLVTQEQSSQMIIDELLDQAIHSLEKRYLTL